MYPTPQSTRPSKLMSPACEQLGSQAVHEGESLAFFSSFLELYHIQPHFLQAPPLLLVFVSLVPAGTAAGAFRCFVDSPLDFPCAAGLFVHGFVDSGSRSRLGSSGVGIS